MVERIVYAAIALVLAAVAFHLGVGALDGYADATGARHPGLLAQIGHWATVAGRGLAAAFAGVAALLVLLMGLGVETPDSILRDAHWCDLLFRDHTQRQLRDWARSLRYFRFVRGSGGGMDDHGDRLAVLLRVDAPGDGAKILATLSASDTPAAGAELPSAIVVAGVKVGLYTRPDRIELQVTDTENPWEVTQAAVDSARAVEVVLESLAGKLIDPPQDDKYCICPKFYPSFWTDPPPPGAAA